MKTLILVRHAKSSWDNPGISDHNRPLNERGLRDAPFMAQVAKVHFPPADYLLSSTANRAHTTARFFAEAFGLDPASIDRRSELYLCDAEDILSAVRQLDNQVQTVYVFNHNPTLEYLVATLEQTYHSDPFPTCAMARFDCPVERWADFSEKLTKKIGFFYPKQFPELP